MAQAIFNDICSKRNLTYEGLSAGIWTRSGCPASQNSILAMRDMGIDISDFRSTEISDVNMDEICLFAVMTPEHKEALISFGIDKSRIQVLNEANGGISDPYGGSEARYLICRDELLQSVEELLMRMGEDQ